MAQTTRIEPWREKTNGPYIMPPLAAAPGGNTWRAALPVAGVHGPSQLNRTLGSSSE